jgi:hypothetical protein
MDDDGRTLGPLDAADPRYVPGAPEDVVRDRRLVRSAGPGPSPMDPRVRVLRIAVPGLFVAGILLVLAVFAVALRPARQVMDLGPEATVRAAVAERPKRVCLGGNLPCAWVTVVDGTLLALNTSGPLREEFGRQGVGWCPTSGYFGSNALGTRYDQQGHVVAGPAPRGLDRYRLRLDAGGHVILDFRSLTAGLQAFRTRAVRAPLGPDCPTIPFDREADLLG